MTADRQPECQVFRTENLTGKEGDGRSASVVEKYEDTLRTRGWFDPAHHAEGHLPVTLEERDALADAIRIARTWTTNTALATLTNEQCRELMRGALARLDALAKREPKRNPHA